MATYASRPAWGLRTRAMTSAKVAVPARPRARSSLVSLLLRTTELGIGFWIDEGLSVGIADRPLGDIPEALRKDGSPPLYYMLLHFWLDLAGSSEAGRALAQPAVRAAGRSRSRFWAGRAVWGTDKAGWFSAILMAFNPFLAQYAQEARMYSMVAFLAIPVTACFIKAYALDTPNRRPWIAGFAVSEAVSLYTHNWPIFFAIAAGVAFLVPARRSATAARRSSATACWASAAPSCSTCRGCRRRSTRPPTPARRGRTRPRSARCSASRACCSGGCRRSCC